MITASIRVVGFDHLRSGSANWSSPEAKDGGHRKSRHGDGGVEGWGGGGEGTRGVVGVYMETREVDRLAAFVWCACRVEGISFFPGDSRTSSIQAWFPSLPFVFVFWRGNTPDSFSHPLNISMAFLLVLPMWSYRPFESFESTTQPYIFLFSRKQEDRTMTTLFQPSRPESKSFENPEVRSSTKKNK